MKKIFLLTLVSVIAFTNCSEAQQSPKATAEGDGIKVTYSQPSKKGREIFGGLVPYGQVWRTGANNATEITFSKDVKFGGKEVKAGTYTLFTLPTEKEWTVILNSDTKFWGTEYEKHKAKNVVEVKVPSSKLDKVVETFLIRIEGGNLIMEWDATRVAVKVG